MTRLQQEIARKLHTLGCASEYKTETGILNITLEHQPICRIHPDDSYTYLPNDHTTDEQVDAFHAAEKMIDVTKEYISAYENAPQFELDGIKDYRKLSEFGGVVFGAKDMGERYGFQFSSWFKTYGGTGATMGDYSFDYEYSKQSFAERSGLVNKSRQFTTKQLEDIHRCVAFAKDMVDGLTYEQERTLEKLMDKIESALPYISDDPQFDVFPSEDDGMTME